MSDWNKFAKEVNTILSMKSNDISYNTNIKNLKRTVASIKNSPEHLGQLEMVIESKKKKARKYLIMVVAIA